MDNHRIDSQVRPQLAAGYALLVLTTLMWAGAWLTARLAAHDAPALTVSVGRFAVAAVALLPIWLATDGRRRPKLSRQDWMVVIGMSLTGMIAYNILFLVGIRLAPASDGAVITPGTAGSFAVLIAFIFRGERPARRAMLGAALAMTGAFLVGWSAIRSAGAEEQRLLGDGLFFISASAWGAYTVLGKQLAGRVSATTVIFLTSLIGALMLAPIAFWVDGVPNISAWSAAAVFNVLYLGVAATAVAFVTYYLAVKRIGIDRMAPTLGLVPLFGVVGAAILLGERITPLHALGGVIVITGIVIPALRSPRRGRE